jgi:hypothetical protein
MSRPTYDKPTTELIKEFSRKLMKGAVFSREDVIEWFSKHYPKTRTKTVEINVHVMTTNSSNRQWHPRVLSGAGYDLWFRMEGGKYRHYEPKRDPPPLYSSRSPSRRSKAKAAKASR